MDLFDIHQYDRMPVPPPVPPAEVAFDVLFQRRAPPMREPDGRIPFWRTWRMNRD